MAQRVILIEIFFHFVTCAALTTPGEDMASGTCVTYTCKQRRVTHI